MDFTAASSSDLTAFAKTLYVNHLARHATFETAAEQITAALYDALRLPDGSPLFALLRVFRFGQQADLPPDVLALSTPDTRYWLTLVATRGVEPAWCDRTQSAGHRAIPAESYATPMLRAAFEQIGMQMGTALYSYDDKVVNASTSNGTSYFYVAQAEGSPAVPDQAFVAQYGVGSVLGIGSPLLDHSACMYIGFARAALTRADAEKFALLSPFVMTLLSAYNTRERLWNPR
jgi:hypothetical protein